MYGNVRTADVNFIFISDGQQEVRIPAHKSVLADGSPVFSKMFFGDLRDNGDVFINDVTAEPFNEFLQFFYLDEVKLTKECVAQVLHLSDKYDVQDGIARCEEFLAIILNPKTMCWGYDLALLYDLKKLIHFCDKSISFNTKSILNTESFMNCSRDVVKQILLMNHVSCTELDIFEACMKWANQFNDTTSIEQQKLILGELFELIRFPTMTIRQFTTCLENRQGMLNSGEIADILIHIAEGCPLVAAKRFNCHKRLWKLPNWSWSRLESKEILYCRPHVHGTDLDHYDGKDSDDDDDTDSDDDDGSDSDCDDGKDSDVEDDKDSGDDDDDSNIDLAIQESLTFRSNVKIQLLGFATEKIKARRCNAYKYHMKIAVQIWSYNGCLNAHEFVLNYSTSLYTDCKNYIKFSEPIVIDPQYWYQIRIIFEDNLQHMYIQTNIKKTKKTHTLGHGIEIKFNELEEHEFSKSASRLISEFVFQFDSNKPTDKQ